MTQEGSPQGTVTALPLTRTDGGDAAKLVAVIRRLSIAQSMPEIMATVTHAARTLLEADGITFVLREGDLCYYAEEDAIAPLWKGKRFPARACISGWCMEHARPVAIADITRDARIPQDAYRPTFVKSLAMVPVGQEEPIAALGAYWASVHEVAAVELELLQTVANAAALATALVQVQQQKSAGQKLQRLASGFSDRLQELSALRRLRIRERPFISADLGKEVLIGIGFCSAAYAARLALVPLLGSEMPFASFYLAVVGAVLSAGLVGGITAILIGGLLGQWAFVAPTGELSFAGEAGWAFVTFTLVASTLVYFIHRLQAAQVTEHAHNEKLQLIGEELQHRFKNFIAVTQALALQTSRSSIDHDDFREKFTGRLQALGSAQTLLKHPAHSTVVLPELVDQALAPFRHSKQIAVGLLPPVLVAQDVGTGLALVLNELATNALKHGALSTAVGNVTLRAETQEDQITLIWEEANGPPVVEPDRHGFGTRLIRSAIPRDAGSTHIEYGKEGLACRIEFSPSAEGR